MKPIKISPEQKEIIIRDFIDQLDKARLSDNKFNYAISLSKVLTKNVIRPTINMTAEAYLKMLALVLTSNDEIGWHGCVNRKDNVYTIYDIIVYPQQVSAARVTTDEEEYGTWLIKELDDKTFNHLRFQGHSHVNMTTNPSGLDAQMYDSILQTLKQGDYYIFCIMNKSRDVNIWLYDFALNFIFEKEDIDFNILVSGQPLTKWFEEQNKLVKKMTTYYTNTPAKEKDSLYPYSARSFGDDETDQYARLNPPARVAWKPTKGGKHK